MYYYDSCMFALHPERKNFPMTFESYLPEILKRAAIRRNHEYFYKTLWKSNRFQFGAAKKVIFFFASTRGQHGCILHNFRDHMLTKYIPSRRNVLPDNELEKNK